eukprot:gene13367-19214_t
MFTVSSVQQVIELIEEHATAACSEAAAPHPVNLIPGVVAKPPDLAGLQYWSNTRAHIEQKKKGGKGSEGSKAKYTSLVLAAPPPPIQA